MKRCGKDNTYENAGYHYKAYNRSEFFDGQNTVRNPQIARNIMGYLPQEVSVYPNLTAYEYLNYVAALKGMKKGEAIYQIKQLLLEFHLEDVMEKRLGGFSGGMKQRIGIISALLNNPKFIIADEPTTGLDPEERITVRNMLSELAQERIVIFKSLYWNMFSTHLLCNFTMTIFQIDLLTPAFSGWKSHLVRCQPHHQ